MVHRSHNSKEGRDIDYRLRKELQDGEFRAKDLLEYGSARAISGVLRSWKNKGWIRKVRKGRDEGGSRFHVWQKTELFGRNVA